VALASNTSGNSNTAIGSLAAALNATGIDNVAVGGGALGLNVAGSNNIAIGAAAAQVSGDLNNTIEIGNIGVVGDDGVIRLGTAGTHTSFFAAGIRDVTTGASDAVGVVIDSTGQLGTINSSRRYKEDIKDMGDASSGLMRLRPVTFRYKQAYSDGSKPIDYGLIAEEVEQVYPDLVAHLANGDVETVQYQKVNAMLLNEVQKQHAELERQRDEITALRGRLEALERERR
jgi:hypothetical protein